jgi:hypothetical protein
MKTEKEINQAILEITMKIRNEYPELIKYLSEMPVTIPDVENPEMTIKVLSDYYESLKNIVTKYISSHN